MIRHPKISSRLHFGGFRWPRSGARARILGKVGGSAGVMRWPPALATGGPFGIPRPSPWWMRKGAGELTAGRRRLKLGGDESVAAGPVGCRAQKSDAGRSLHHVQPPTSQRAVYAPPELARTVINISNDWNEFLQKKASCRRNPGSQTRAQKGANTKPPRFGITRHQEIRQRRQPNGRIDFDPARFISPRANARLLPRGGLDCCNYVRDMPRRRASAHWHSQPTRRRRQCRRRT